MRAEAVVWEAGLIGWSRQARVPVFAVRIGSCEGRLAPWAAPGAGHKRTTRGTWHSAHGAVWRPVGGEPCRRPTMASTGVRGKLRRLQVGDGPCASCLPWSRLDLQEGTRLPQHLACAHPAPAPFPPLPPFPSPWAPPPPAAACAWSARRSRGLTPSACCAPRTTSAG